MWTSRRQQLDDDSKNLLNRWTLNFTSKEQSENYFKLRFSNFLLPFVAYIVMCVAMLIYKIWLTTVGAYDWDFNNEACQIESVKAPSVEQRVFFNCLAVVFYIVTAGVYAFAHYKNDRFFISINFLLIITTCFNNYMSMPFNPSRPREFVYWSTILIFRCSFIVSMFGLNGMWDVIASILIPAAAILAQSFNINDANSSEHIAVPIFATLIGVALFNYILGFD
jgi:hypothetical protein